MLVHLAGVAPRTFRYVSIKATRYPACSCAQRCYFSTYYSGCRDGSSGRAGPWPWRCCHLCFVSDGHKIFPAQSGGSWKECKYWNGLSLMYVVDIVAVSGWVRWNMHFYKCYLYFASCAKGLGKAAEIRHYFIRLGARCTR